MIWIPLPAIAALRQDLSALGPDALQDSTSSSGWLALALILERQARRVEELPNAPLAERLRSILDEIGGRTRPRLEDHSPKSAPGLLLQRIRAVAEEMEEAGALRLAESALAAAQDAADGIKGWPSGSELALERGRMLAQRARLAWKAGATEVAADRYRRVGALGVRARLPELLARAKAGQAALAQIAGDWALMRRRARAARRLAAAVGRPTLVALSHHFLMVAAAKQKRWSAALIHGWEAYRGSAGDREREAERLLNLAQMLLDTGRPAAARSGFVEALRRDPPARLRLPALGGLAIAYAQLGEAGLVQESAIQALELIGRDALPVHSGELLLELATAYSLVRDDTAIARLVERARLIERTDAGPSLVARLEELRAFARRVAARDERPAPTSLTPRGEAVATAVLSLAA